MNEQQIIVFNEINKIQFKNQARHNITEDGKGNNRGIAVGYIKNREHYTQNLGYPKYAISRTLKTKKCDNLFFIKLLCWGYLRFQTFFYKCSNK